MIALLAASIIFFTSNAPELRLMNPVVRIEPRGSARRFTVHNPNAVIASAAQSSPPQILIVEDHAEVRHVVARALRASGLASFEATDANEARLLLETVQFDIAVLDISLPGTLNGIQLGQWVRLRNPGMPLIFMTGLTEWEMPEPVPNDPHTRFLRKPFGARVITDYVCSLLAPNVEASEDISVLAPEA